VKLTVVAAAGPRFVTLCVYVTLLPAATEIGEAELAVTKSDCVERATTSVAVALLFPELGSVVEELMLTVSVIAVPAAVPAFTFTTTGKLAVPGAKLGLVQAIVAPRTHAQPGGTGLRETNVVFAGTTSVKLTLLAVLGPALVTTWV
jgi:hypothetical protein